MAIERHLDSPNVCASLRHIIDISSAHGLTDAAITTRFCPPTLSVADFHLPSPSPIHDTLAALRLQRSVARRISDLYQEAACRIQDASEAKWRKAVHACTQINRHFGQSAYDATTLRASALSVYLRSLQELEARVVYSCRRQLQQQAIVSIPKGVSVRDDTICISTSKPSTHAYRTHNFAGRHAIKDILTNTLHPELSSFATYVEAEEDRGKHAGQRANVPVSLTDITREELPVSRRNAFRGEPPVHAYPHRYTHSQASPNCTLPSSSKDFFSHTSSNRPVSSAEHTHLSSLLDKLGALRLGTPSPEPKTNESSRIQPSLQPSSYPGFPHAPSRLNLPKASRRKLAPVPKRASQAAGARQPSPPMAELGCRTPASSHLRSSSSMTIPYASSQDPPSIALSSHAPTVPVAVHHPSISTDVSRPRKVAPLPRRQLPKSARVSSSQRICEISRAPSLVSLSSSCPGSPSPSDDDLDTPPSSPSSMTCDLTAITGLKSSTSLFDAGLPLHIDVSDEHDFPYSESSSQARAPQYAKFASITKGCPALF